MATRLKKTDERVFYLYGVTPSDPGENPSQTGVDLVSPIETVACDDVVCWVSRVSPQDFEADLAKNMENLDWLATASVAHQRAISAIAAKADILPARFGTVFRDEKSLLSHIRERLQSIRQDFKRVKDSDEWGVKLFAEVPSSRPIAPAKSGREYLQAKAAMLPRKNDKLKPDEEIVEFANKLSAIAKEAAPGGSVSGGQRGLLYQVTLLVPRSRQKKFHALLKQFSDRWRGTRRIECTGPWPPYSFVSRNGDNA